jgi:hypothetical protein
MHFPDDICLLVYWLLILTGNGNPYSIDSPYHKSCLVSVYLVSLQRDVQYNTEIRSFIFTVFESQNY